jgi:hypothetical protein
MKTKRFLFVSSVVLLAAVCLGVMNMKYDRLSRYPYEDEEARELIDHFFTNEEISYLIEYSIAPSEFIEYIDAPGFSIYHASQYNQVKESIWYLNDDNIVFLVELSFGKMSVEELIHTLLNYDADTVVHFLQKGDEYLSGSSLIEYPTSLTVIVDDTHTLSSRILFDAIAISSLPSASGEPLMVSEVVVDPIKAMCIAIEKDLDNKQTCGGLVAQSGYVPYEQQQMPPQNYQPPKQNQYPQQAPQYQQQYQYQQTPPQSNQQAPQSGYQQMPPQGYQQPQQNGYQQQYTAPPSNVSSNNDEVPDGFLNDLDGDGFFG